MKLKVLSLVMRIPEAVFFVKIARHLGARGVQMEFVAGHESACDVFKKEGLVYYNIHHRVTSMASRFTGDDMKTSQDVQNRFNIANLRNIYLREKLHFGRFDEQMMLRKTLAYLNVMDGILVESNPNIVVQETGDFVAPNCLYHAARARNIHHIFIEPGMFPNTIVFASNSFFADIPPDILGASPSREDLCFAEEYMRQYHRSKLTRVPTKDRVFFQDMGLGAMISFANLKKLARKLFHKYIARKSEEYNAISHHCISHAMRVFRRKRLSRLYTTELPHGPFVYFPLHVPLDLQLTTRCREYLDQLSLVEYISTCIPPGYRLLMKEHPASIGGYSYSRIRDMLKHNTHIHLVHPSVNSYDIIKQSRSVITINSKVGAEAIIQCKPIIVLGPTFYRGKGLTIDVDRLKDLQQAVGRALAGEQLDVAEVQGFLASVRKWSWPGELFDAASENVGEFCDSLWRYIQTVRV